MNRRTPIFGLITLITLTLAAAYVLAVDAWKHNRLREGDTEFQRLVGGLGMGTDIHLSDCANSFDPRFRSVCLYGDTHVPVSMYFCPHHSCSILYLKMNLPADEAEKHSRHSTINGDFHPVPRA